jgi:hypothetical protein
MMLPITPAACAGGMAATTEVALKTAAIANRGTRLRTPEVSGTDT